MSIIQKVKSVEQLFTTLDIETNSFQSQTNLHCLSGCGKCCTKPDIDASPLEFLPWAFNLFVTERILDVLDELNKRSHPVCQIYVPLSITDSSSGRCGEYQHRGLICRLFGYAASRDKYGKLQLVTCKIIKEDQPENHEQAAIAINEDLSIPIFTEYYMRLAQIDVRLGNIVLPINKAMIMAIEEVLHYYAYRPFPEGYNAA